MDEAFKKELIEHCKRQMQRFERMGRTDSFFHISDSEGETWDNFDVVEREVK